MRTSTNYGLKLPEGTDNVKRQDFVENFEKIDLELKNNDTSLKEIANKVDNIKIADGTITTKGIVKLNNATNSISQTEAATPLAVKTAMDKANEAFTSASNGKSYIAGKVGNVSGNNTFTQIGDRVQIDKNDFATQLNAKNVSASGNEALASLVGKIANITVESLNGKFYAYGQTNCSTNSQNFNYIVNPSVSSSSRYIDITLPFTARKIIANTRPSSGFIGGIMNDNYCFTLKVSGSNINSPDGLGNFSPIITGNTIRIPVYNSILGGTQMYWEAYS